MIFLQKIQINFNFKHFRLRVAAILSFRLCVQALGTLECCSEDAVCIRSIRPQMWRLAGEKLRHRANIWHGHALRCAVQFPGKKASYSSPKPLCPSQSLHRIPFVCFRECCLHSQAVLSSACPAHCVKAKDAGFICAFLLCYM